MTVVPAKAETKKAAQISLRGLRTFENPRLTSGPYLYERG